MLMMMPEVRTTHTKRAELSKQLARRGVREGLKYRVVLWPRLKEMCVSVVITFSEIFQRQKFILHCKVMDTNEEMLQL